jgi:hypothetical protein
MNIAERLAFLEQTVQAQAAEISRLEDFVGIPDSWFDKLAEQQPSRTMTPPPNGDLRFIIVSLSLSKTKRRFWSGLHGWVTDANQAFPYSSEDAAREQLEGLKPDRGYRKGEVMQVA